MERERSCNDRQDSAELSSNYHNLIQHSDILQSDDQYERIPLLEKGELSKRNIAAMENPPVRTASPLGNIRPNHLIEARHCQENTKNLGKVFRHQQRNLISRQLPKPKNSVNKPEREQGTRVKIKVSGRPFEVYASTLTSKEGSIFKNPSIIKYYDCTSNEYVFDDRDPRAFEAILTYMQCGILSKPEQVSMRCFIIELLFYGFSDIARRRFQQEIVMTPTDQHSGQINDIGVRNWIYETLENPSKNCSSQIISALSALVVIISITSYCILTYPGITKEMKAQLHYVEYVCNIWFTTDLLSRFLLCPAKWKFCKKFMNLIDLVSILPFYMDVIFKSSDVIGLAMLRVLRVGRVMRVFKLSRYSIGVNLITNTLVGSIHELLILIFFLVIAVIFYSALIYFCEHDYSDSTNKFKSVPQVFWFVIVTITTVGYGDMYPSTAGKCFHFPPLLP